MGSKEHRGTRQQDPHTGNSQSRRPQQSPGHEGPPAASKGLIGVKPGEFGTAARKSRPAREPRAGSGAASPRPRCSSVVVANSARSSAASPGRQGPHRRPRNRSCAGAEEGLHPQLQPSQREARKCKITRCHPGLSNNPPLEGNLAHASLRPPAKCCWERGFTRGLETPRRSL